MKSDCLCACVCVCWKSWALKTAIHQGIICFYSSPGSVVSSHSEADTTHLLPKRLLTEESRLSLWFQACNIQAAAVETFLSLFQSVNSDFFCVYFLTFLQSVAVYSLSPWVCTCVWFRWFGDGLVVFVDDLGGRANYLSSLQNLKAQYL